MPCLPILERATTHADREAIRVGTRVTTYRELLARSASVSAALRDGRDDLAEARVGFLISPGEDYVAVQWGVWQAGGIAVPLSLHATERELAYVLQDAGVEVLLASEDQAPKLVATSERMDLRLLCLSQIPERQAPMPEVEPNRRAMILYTSGTTGRPKGVVTTHAMIRAQIESLIEAWRWTCDDRIPLFLPLHHVHGIINILSCALWSGASVEVFERFDVKTVLARVTASAYSVFMAVPTIYVKLIDAIETLSGPERKEVVDGFRMMRLMVSGSAALPASVHEHWSVLTGHALLERYGMTEIGMALSNPYDGERRPGAVGQPLPGVHVRLVDNEGAVITTPNTPGEIQVQGPGVFREYWERPEATDGSFTDGWFRTGDVAEVDDGYFRIMGRNSIDIIKSGGYKLSALEIESVLLDHPDIQECAVVGLPDNTWGQTVAAAVVTTQGAGLTEQCLHDWCSDSLSTYKIPRSIQFVDTLPRNAMGKIIKPDVVTSFASLQ